MKVIDKTNKSEKWGYGTILKCWDDDPDEFELYRIASAHNREHGNAFEADILYDHLGRENLRWGSNIIYTNVVDIKRDFEVTYDHVVPVKATITIEDL